MSPPPLPVHFTTEDMAEAFRHFLPKVEEIPAGEVPVRGTDAELARYNIERGVNAVLPRIAEVPDLLPDVSVKAILELPALALALVYADGRVSIASPRDIDAAIVKVSALHELTLSYLKIADALGLIRFDRAPAIRVGTSRLAIARDCVGIAGIFEEHEAALAGKHPFTRQQLTELATTGAWLVKSLSSLDEAMKDPAQRARAAGIRDRFWKAVEDGHDHLRTVGMALFGIKSVDDAVPPLFSGSIAASSEEGPAAQDDGRR